MDFSMKDTYRNYVETVSGGKNTVIYDQHGNPNIMVIINRFTNDYLGFGTGTHPAFIVGDKEVDEIFIGKYMARQVPGGYPSSMPGQKPWVNITLQEARDACAEMGDGFHLVTNAEYAAVAVLGWRNGYSFNFFSDRKNGIPVPGDACAHDGSQFGVQEMGSQCWEYVDGCKQVKNQIYVHAINGKPCNWAGVEDIGEDNSHYMATGVYLSGAGNSQDNVKVIFSNTPPSGYTGCAPMFKLSKMVANCVIPDYFKQLAIFPPDDADISYGGYWVCTNATGVNRAYRGSGDAYNRSGWFSFAMSVSETELLTTGVGYRGFRFCYIPGIKQGKGWA